MTQHQMGRRIVMVFVGLCAALGASAELADIYDAGAGAGDSGQALNLAGRSGTITIDTDAMTISGPISPTRYGVDVDGVCVFRFTSVNIGSGVNVVIRGNRPLAITSNTDIILDADLVVPSGTLGSGRGGNPGQGGQGGRVGPNGAGGVGGVGGAGGAGGVVGSQGTGGTSGSTGASGGSTVPPGAAPTGKAGAVGTEGKPGSV
ncbi:MAG TPA: hypothetical protein PKI11_18000, partial [Candidatus Hydrogenedentes bacterium]|nr:hypothetical protein [Candidatus Hydrogenedentota bacterium]